MGIQVFVNIFVRAFCVAEKLLEKICNIFLQTFVIRVLFLCDRFAYALHQELLGQIIVIRFHVANLLFGYFKHLRDRQRR